jgi:hypothetical protein
MSEHKGQRTGVEVRGVYDGVLFWWYPESNTTELREGMDWIYERVGNINEIMEKFRRARQKEREENGDTLHDVQGEREDGNGASH